MNFRPRFFILIILAISCCSISYGFDRLICASSLLASKVEVGKQLMDNRSSFRKFSQVESEIIRIFDRDRKEIALVAPWADFLMDTKNKRYDIDFKTDHNSWFELKFRPKILHGEPDWEQISCKMTF